MSAGLLALAGFEWGHPGRLALLALPLGVLLFARRRREAERRMSATLELWQRVAASAPNAAERRRGPIPLALACACASLALCVLALAGPRTAEPTRGESWQIVVDRSPSMYLPNAARTRLAVAIEAAQAFLDERGIEGGAREWIDASDARAERVRAARIPDAWLEPPTLARREVGWTRFDQGHVVWLTDHGSSAPRSAVLIESGGPAVPGVVSAAAGKLWTWDGNTSLQASTEPLAGRVTIDGSLARPLEELLRAWCELAGLACVRAPPDTTSLLALRGITGASEREATLAIGAGTMRVRFVGATDSVSDGFERERWLASDTLTLVDWRAGEIRTTLTGLEFVGGERAAIALAWGDLFQRAIRLPSAVVPLTERLAAGEARRTVGRDSPVDRGRETKGLAAACASAAAALLALAWLARAWRA